MFNKSKNSKQCIEFESRFEDFLAGAPDAELQAHVSQCEQCSSALEDSRLAGSLLRESLEPASEATHAFLFNVMARIHEQEAELKSPAAFWAPLQFLASRVAFTAAVVLLGLSVYLFEYAPHRNISFNSIRTELNASDFPQPPADPVSNEEVLQSLAVRGNGQ